MNETMLHVFIRAELNIVRNFRVLLIIATCIYVINLNLSEEGKFYVFYQFRCYSFLFEIFFYGSSSLDFIQIMDFYGFGC